MLMIERIASSSGSELRSTQGKSLDAAGDLSGGNFRRNPQLELNRLAIGAELGDQPSRRSTPSYLTLPRTAPSTQALRWLSFHHCGTCRILTNRAGEQPDGRSGGPALGMARIPRASTNLPVMDAHCCQITTSASSPLPSTVRRYVGLLVDHTRLHGESGNRARGAKSLSTAEHRLRRVLHRLHDLSFLDQLELPRALHLVDKEVHQNAVAAFKKRRPG